MFTRLSSLWIRSSWPIWRSRSATVSYRPYSPAYVVGGRHVLQFGMLRHVGHVLVLGVVLEVGVEPVAQLGPHQEQQPRHVVVEERHEPRCQPVQQERLLHAVPLDEVLQDQQVPLLVVLLLARLDDPLVHALGERRAAAVPRQREVAHALPRLVRDAGDELQHRELHERALAAVDQVHLLEQHPGEQPVLQPRAFEGLDLGGAQLQRGELRRAGVDGGVGAGEGLRRVRHGEDAACTVRTRASAAERHLPYSAPITGRRLRYRPGSKGDPETV
ncbi:hypothetical protein LUW76_39015 [Actinomadura madurae]|nr:hypothetical protein [Actinomadura madurae]URM99832.1 hypothetical protein LUW76_39015 [Actinomadura madurae]